MSSLNQNQSDEINEPQLNVMICVRSKEAADALNACAAGAGVDPIDQTRKRSLDGNTPLHILLFLASMHTLGTLKALLLELVKQRKIEYIKIGDREIRNATVSEISKIMEAWPTSNPGPSDTGAPHS